jgi:hypothetical protein
MTRIQRSARAACDQLRMPPSPTDPARCHGDIGGRSQNRAIPWHTGRSDRPVPDRVGPRSDVMLMIHLIWPPHRVAPSVRRQCEGMIGTGP